MGGAFTAVADDATAVSWNPAGLTNLETPEFSVVGSYFITSEDLKDFDTDISRSIHRDVTFDEDTEKGGDLNFMSIAYPFVLWKNLYTVASLNYKQVFDLNSKRKFEVKDTGAGDSFGQTWNVDFESDGGVGSISPAFAVQVTHNISLGLTVNYFTNELFRQNASSSKSKIHSKGSDALGNKIELDGTKRTDLEDFDAVNFTIGLLWDFYDKGNKRLTLGIAVDTPYTARVKTTEASVIRGNISGPFTGEEPIYEPSEESERFDIDFPLSVSVGFAFQISGNDTVSFDTTWTDWSEWILEKDDGTKLRPIGVDQPSTVRVEDTIAVRAGYEHLLTYRHKAVIPIRGGLFYDPQPALDHSTDVLGFSLGSGITYGRYSLDFAYQFQYADNIETRNLGLSGEAFDEIDHKFFTSLIVKF